MKRYLLITLMLLPAIAMAKALAPETNILPGIDYAIIQQNPDIPSKPQNKITVTEFFSYGCPWCYKLEPSLNSWVKQQPMIVSFNRVPVIFEKNWDTYAKAYYISQALGITDKITPAMFNAIQEKNQEFSSPKELVKLFTEQGADEKFVINALDSSPTLDAQLKQSVILMRAYQITMVPTLVVNNEYRTDLKMAKGDNQRLLKIIDFLIAKVKTENKVPS